MGCYAVFKSRYKIYTNIEQNFHNHNIGERFTVLRRVIIVKLNNRHEGEENMAKEVWAIVDPEKAGPQEILENEIYQLDYDGVIVGGTFHLYADILTYDVDALKELGHRVGVFAFSEYNVTGNADFVLAALPVNSQRTDVLNDFIGILNAAEERGVPVIPLVYIVSSQTSSVAMMLRPYDVHVKDYILKRYIRFAKRLGAYLYLEGGSGTQKTINIDLIKVLSSLKGDIPLTVGGGIRSEGDVKTLFSYGVDKVVIGTLVERGRREEVEKILELRNKF